MTTNEDNSASILLRFDKSKTFGRKKEKLILRRALNDTLFNRVQDSSRIVLVKGLSGTGKTALVESVLRPLVLDSKCLFAFGKCDQFLHQKTFSCLVDALNNLCSILSESTKIAIRQAFRAKENGTSNTNRHFVSHSDMEVLCNLVPSVRGLLDHRQEDTTGKNQPLRSSSSSYWSNNAQGRLHLLRLKSNIRSLLLCITSHQPVVLSLTDLQWADDDLIDLIRVTLFEETIPRLLLVCSYRTEDEETDDPPIEEKLLPNMMTPAGDDRQSGYMETKRHIIHMELGGLSVDDLQEFLASTFRVDMDAMSTDSGEDSSDDDDQDDSSEDTAEDIIELAELIHHKTLGNMFYVLQFLETLQRKQLLWYSFETYRWDWDIHLINSETVLADNAVDLVASRLRSLPPDTQDILCFAACMGNRFDGQVLAWVLESWKPVEQSDAMLCRKRYNNQDEIMRILDCVCQEEHLLEKMTTDPKQSSMRFQSSRRLDQCVYKFSHNRIQQGAYELIANDETRLLFHSHIGNALWTTVKNSSFSSTQDWMILVAADQFKRCGAAYIHKNCNCGELASLFYEAACQVRLISAYFAAVEYLRMCISLLGSNRWEKDRYTLTLQASNLCCEMEFCCGNIDNCKFVAKDVMEHSACVEDTFVVRDVLISCHVSQGSIDAAFSMCNSLLRDLKVPRPTKTMRLKRIFELLSTYRRLSALSDEELLEYPTCTDKKLLLTLRIMAKQINIAWLAGRVQDAGFLAVRMIEASLHHGISEVAPMAFCMFGSVLVKIGKEREGYRLGGLALQISNRFESKEWDAVTLVIYNGFLHHLYNPYTSCLDSLLHGHQMGMSAGRIDSAHYCVSVYVSTHLLSGLPLVPLEHDISAFKREMVEYRQYQSLALCEVHHQVVLNLAGRFEGHFALHQVAKDWQVSGQEGELRKEVRYFCLLLLACFYGGDADTVKRIALENVMLQDRAYPSITSILAPFYRGLAWVNLVRVGQRSFLRRAKSEVRRLQDFAKKGFLSSLHALTLLQAEILSLDGSVPQQEVQKAYSTAINIASRSGFIHHAALGFERAGTYFTKRGDHDWGKYYIENACLNYEEWGAQGKVELLRACFDVATGSSSSLSGRCSSSISTTRTSSLYGRKRHSASVVDKHRETDWLKVAEKQSTPRVALRKGLKKNLPKQASKRS